MKHTTFFFYLKIAKLKNISVLKICTTTSPFIILGRNRRFLIPFVHLWLQTQFFGLDVLCFAFTGIRPLLVWTKLHVLLIHSCFTALNQPSKKSLSKKRYFQGSPRRTRLMSSDAQLPVTDVTSRSPCVLFKQRTELSRLPFENDSQLFPQTELSILSWPLFQSYLFEKFSFE